MRFQRLRDRLHNERGNVLLFTFTLLVLVLVMGGFAIDFAYQAAARTELQRSMDAAALAGAGKLGFNDSVFDIPCGPAAQTCSGVRQNAQRFASRNPYRVGTINLDLNLANAANGDIVLGIWNGTGFTPSQEGSQVNAVLCRSARQIPTSFLRLLGFNSLAASAEAIAWAPPPASPPPTACPFPVAASSCFFNSGGSGATSSGCGATIQFTSSSDQSQLGANTAAWVSLDPNANNVNANDTKSAVDAAASGTCGASPIQTGDTVPVNGGELASVIKNHVQPAFISKYNASPELVVYAQDGTTVTYQGKGWEVFVPVIGTGPTCPPGSQINGNHQVVGWTRMVITQVLDKNGECAVANHWAGNPWDAKCFDSKNGTAPAGSPTVVQGNTGIFGYFDCQYSPSPPATSPGPISATAKLKLVR
jgi:Putative Flp pilus-assembly TadE/G-like